MRWGEIRGEWGGGGLYIIKWWNNRSDDSISETLLKPTSIQGNTENTRFVKIHIFFSLREVHRFFKMRIWEYIKNFHHSIILFTIMVDKIELRNNFFSTSFPRVPLRKYDVIFPKKFFFLKNHKTTRGFTYFNIKHGRNE